MGWDGFPKEKTSPAPSPTFHHGRCREEHHQEEGKSILIPTVPEAKGDWIKPLHYVAMKEKQVQNDKRRVKQACCAQGGVLLPLGEV